jgi:hypothetical protein
MRLQMATQMSQICTFGPAMSRCTLSVDFPQKEQCSVRRRVKGGMRQALLDTFILSNLPWHNRKSNLSTHQGSVQLWNIVRLKQFSSRTIREIPMLGTILIIILILLLLGALPTWGYSGSWGYGPSGILGTVLVVIVILVLIGRI